MMDVENSKEVMQSGKTEKLIHQYIGQMDFYGRFYENQIKKPGDNSTCIFILYFTECWDRQGHTMIFV